MSDRTCSIDGCARPVKSRGWCQAHYFRWRRNGDPGGPVLMLKGQPKQPCHIDGCERDVDSLGLCDPHYPALPQVGRSVLHRRTKPVWS